MSSNDDNEILENLDFHPDPQHLEDAEEEEHLQQCAVCRHILMSDGAAYTALGGEMENETPELAMLDGIRHAIIALVEAIREE